MGSSIRAHVTDLNWADVDHYVFEDISHNWSENHQLTAEEFISIIVWKSNRSIGYVCKRMRSKDHSNIEQAVYDLTRNLYESVDTMQD